MHKKTEKFDETSFNELVKQLSQGDAAAAEKVVRDFEPEIRRIVRARLRDPKLRRVMDSMDICQSVFGRFFVLANLGRFELNSPHDLVKLLTRMATNKVIDKYRSEGSQQNLIKRRVEHSENENDRSKRDRETPESALEYEELLGQAVGLMSEKEIEISNLRNSGLSWVEVSRQLGESPQALRKRFARACSRIADELELH